VDRDELPEVAAFDFAFVQHGISLWSALGFLQHNY
jgi:hypothetical protein